jgi:UDP-glucose 4-epimerase
LETFVIGSSGLIGSAIVNNVENAKPFPIRMPWDNLEQCISNFESWSVAKPNTGIVWAAGTSGVSATKEMLEAEMMLFTAFLNAVKRNEEQISYVLMVSSAGGVYGEASDEVITESTIPNPISDYGNAKLQQEIELTELASSSRFRTLIARVSNAYGPRQDLNKKQGLISHLVQAALSNQPITIYVPMDTKRDYIFADDVGAKISQFISICEGKDYKPEVKIISSGVSSSISEVVSEIDRLTGMSTPIVFAEQRETGLQPTSLVFESSVLTAIEDYACTSLAEGIGSIIESQKRELTQIPNPKI